MVLLSKTYNFQIKQRFYWAKAIFWLGLSLGSPWTPDFWESEPLLSKPFLFNKNIMFARLRALSLQSRQQMQCSRAESLRQWCNALNQNPSMRLGAILNRRLTPVRRKGDIWTACMTIVKSMFCWMGGSYFLWKPSICIAFHLFYTKQ